MFSAALSVLAFGSVALSAPSSAANVSKVPTSIKYNVLSQHKHFFQPTNSTKSKRSCSDYNTAALGTANAMQSMYYNSGGYYTGGSGGGSAWTDVNGVEDLMNFELFNTASYGTTYDGVPEAVFTHYDTQFTDSGAYDDLLWAAIASWKQCDYLDWRGLSTTECSDRAIKYYNIVVDAWDSTCGGGVWWNSEKTYKNAITNELFLYSSAASYLRTQESTYLTNAQSAWSWLDGNPMQNSEGLWNDGLTSSCTNNGQTTWTYNQIVIASGLSALYAATGSTNTALLTAAQVSIDATFTYLTSGGILKETCDSSTGATSCDADQQLFKGLFMKHLQYYLDTADSSTQNSKYTGNINAQASGVVHYATGSGYDVGSVWYAANAGGSIFSPKTQASGLEALNCAAKYTSC
ncbi:Six-hairpin glycosidase [Clavulina sp. PMI_390]|nr:Six-hairpin glycosidase [Clavulina sp. PMI_390]